VEIVLERLNFADHSLLAGLQDLAIEIADPVAEGFPPVEPNHELPCLGNSTRGSCNASGNDSSLV
jgi:hypothetical protein